MWGLIGGSGFENFESFKTVEHLSRETPFGLASSGIKKVKIDEQECLFVSRHGENHENLPSEVNFRANIYALKKYGAKAIMSLSAIGSLQKELKPGDMVVPNQYIDRTKGIRQHTFLGDGVVGHVSLAQPTSKQLTTKLKEVCNSVNFDCHFDKTYVCIEGPYFSTVAESHSYRAMNADIIGMTHFPEFALVSEASLPYLPCCFVTDYDCWDENIAHVTIDKVLAVMTKNNVKAFEITQKILALGPIYEGDPSYEQGLKMGLFMAREQIPDRHKAWLEVLLS